MKKNITKPQLAIIYGPAAIMWLYGIVLRNFKIVILGVICFIFFYTYFSLRDERRKEDVGKKEEGRISES